MLLLTNKPCLITIVHNTDFDPVTSCGTITNLLANNTQTSTCEVSLAVISGIADLFAEIIQQIDNLAPGETLDKAAAQATSNGLENLLRADSPDILQAAKQSISTVQDQFEKILLATEVNVDFVSRQGLIASKTTNQTTNIDINEFIASVGVRSVRQTNSIKTLKNLKVLLTNQN